MAKVKYNLKDATPGGDREHAKPGVYRVKIREVNAKDSKAGNPMLEVVMTPTHDAGGKKLKGEINNVWYYILTDGSQDGRFREFIDALGLKPIGTLDTDKMAGESVRVQLGPDKDQDGDYRPRVKRTLPLDSDEEDEEAEEDEADDSEEAEEDEADDSEEAEDEADDSEEDDDDEDDEDEVDLDPMSRAELKAFIKENDLSIRVTKKMSDDDLRSAIAEAMSEDDDDDEDEDEDDDDDEAPDYDSMSMDALKKLAKERGLSTSGSKKVLTGRLRKDDESGGEPF